MAQFLSASPDVSKKGRSRFSKALPSVPGLAREPRQLPPLPSLPVSPRPPAKQNQPAQRSIARKPVSSARPPEPPSLPASSLGSPAKSTQYATPPSPADSLSSLLSAYSRIPDEPASGGTTTATSSMCSASETSASPPLDGTRSEWTAAAPPKPASKAQPTPPWFDAELPPPPPPPPPPPHDDAKQLQHQHNHEKQLPPPPPAPEPQPRADPVTPPTAQPELWRRRSVKTDTGRAHLPGLKLNHSHGSTAPGPVPFSLPRKPLNKPSSPPLPPPPPPPPEQQPRTPSRSPVVGLPGRNVRPAAKQQGSPPPQHQPVSDTQTMGHAPSSLSQIKNAVRRNRSSVDGATSKTSHTPRPGAQRPPTPEYHKDDAKTTSPAEVLVSPVSPAPSESPRLAQTLSGPKTAPLQDSVGRPDQAPIPRKSLPSTAPSLPGTASLPNLRDALHSSANGQTVSARQRPLDPTGPGRSGDSTLPSPMSVTSDAPLSGPDCASPGAPSPHYRGRDGTLYAEMRVTREPDPRATYFPAQTDKPYAPDTIISSRPPQDSHFSCYQNHKTMNRRSNRNCPLTCQTCDKADTEDRWVCSFCYLRICDSCMRALNGHQRVLRRLVDELAVSTPLSLSSLSRPGSALGLHTDKSS